MGQAPYETKRLTKPPAIDAKLRENLAFILSKITFS